MEIGCLKNEIDRLPMSLPTYQNHGLTEKEYYLILFTEPNYKFVSTELSLKISWLIGLGTYILTVIYLMTDKQWHILEIICLTIVGGFLPFVILGTIAGQKTKKYQRSKIPQQLFDAYDRFTLAQRKTEERYKDAFRQLGINMDTLYIKSVYPDHNKLIDKWTKLFDTQNDIITYVPESDLGVKKKEYEQFFMLNIYKGLWQNDDALVEVFTANYVHNLPYIRTELETAMIDPVIEHANATKIAKEKGLVLDEIANTKEMVSIYNSDKYKKYKDIEKDVNNEKDDNRSKVEILKMLIKKTKQTKIIYPHFAK